MQNRRVFPRYRGRVRVQYGTPTDACGESKIAYTGDVGPAGCHVLTTTPALPGASLDLEISLPGGAIVRMRGVVRWAKKVPHRLSRLGHGGFGVQFEDAPESWFTYCLDMQRRSHAAARRGENEGGQRGDRVDGRVSVSPDPAGVGED